MGKNPAVNKTVKILAFLKFTFGLKRHVNFVCKYRVYQIVISVMEKD